MTVGPDRAESWSSLVEGDEGLYLLNCRINLDLVGDELSIFFDIL